MRLNGKAAIMRYLGRAEQNWRAWVGVKLRYGRVIWQQEKRARRPMYWTRSEWLDALDQEQGHCVSDAEYEKLVAQRHVHLHRLPSARRNGGLRVLPELQNTRG